MSLTEFNQEEYDRNRYDEGKEAGIQEGMKKGEAAGIQTGMLRKALETAKKLLQINMPFAQITDITGLSADQLNKLVNA